MKLAARMEKLPPYLFLELDRLIERQRALGHDIINLGIGDPDQPTPAHIIQALQAAAERPSNHRYPNYLGSPAFRQAVAAWYKKRFDVDLDPSAETVGLIGSKEGIAHLTWAMAGPGDLVIVPDPSYPVYLSQAILAGAEVYDLPLPAERRFLPDLDSIPESVLTRAKMLWVNYPNNPTGATADLSFFEEAVALCRQYDILLCSDLAYAEIGYDGFRAPSALQVDGAKDVTVEFYSLSKPFNMTGWRVAAAVGNPTAVGALGTLKSNLDSGVFTAVQEAAVAALAHDPFTFFKEQSALYAARRNIALNALEEMGMGIPSPLSTFYIWFRTPRGMSSSEASRFFVEEAHVVVAPGSSYGEVGEGWLRASLTCPTDRLIEAFDRMKAAMARIS